MDSEVIEMSCADMAMNGRRVKTRTRYPWRYHVRTQCVARLERVPGSTEADGSDAREEARKNG